MKRFGKLFGLVFCAGFLMSVSCDGGDGSDSGDSTVKPAYDLGGQWDFEETLDGDCSGEEYPRIETGIMTITQTGNTIVAVLPGDRVLNGSISGTVIGFSGDMQEGTGVSTVQITGAASDQGDQIDASGTWTWRSDSGSYACSGTVQFSASRNATGAYYRDISLATVYSHSIVSGGTKAYRFCTAQAGFYTISLAGCTSDLGWALYSFDPDDAAVDDLDDNEMDVTHGDQYYGSTDEVYSLHLPASTYYILVVDEYDGEGPSSYDLSVQYGGESGGEVVTFQDATAE